MSNHSLVQPRRPVKPIHIKPEYVLLMLLAIVSITSFLMVTGVIPTSATTKDSVPVAAMPPEAMATLSAIQSSQVKAEGSLADATTKLNVVTAQLNDAQIKLSDTQRELEKLKAQNNVGPPQDTKALQDQITALRSQIEELTNYGQRTRIGDQMEQVQNVIGWTYQEKPCKEFGQDKNKLLADGVTFVTWEGISWDLSKCFVGFEGWDTKSEKGDYYLAVMFEWSFSYSCSWEPHTTYFEIWQTNGDKALQNKITHELLGNPSPKPIIDAFYGKDLYPVFYQDNGYWCAKDVKTLGAEEVLFRLWPITLSQAQKLGSDGKQNIHWRRPH